MTPEKKSSKKPALKELEEFESVPDSVVGEPTEETVKFRLRTSAPDRVTVRSGRTFAQTFERSQQPFTCSPIVWAEVLEPKKLFTKS